MGLIKLLKLSQNQDYEQVKIHTMLDLVIRSVRLCIE